MKPDVGYCIFFLLALAAEEEQRYQISIERDTISSKERKKEDKIVPLHAATYHISRFRSLDI